jgi:tRNA-dihydrouridine synthase A
VRMSQMTRHILGLFAGRPGARAYRRHLAIEAVKPGAGLETLRGSVAHVRRAAVALEDAA